MMGPTLVVLALLAQVPAAPAAAGALSSAADFESGRIAFTRGEHAAAVKILSALLYPEIRLASEFEVVQAHRMLAVAHLFLNQNDRAAHEFRKLLQLRPDYRFDPLLDTPRVVDFFNGILREQEGALAELETRRKQAELEERRQREAAARRPVIVEKRVVRNVFGLNFVPFGVGQFQNGQARKGWAFTSVEAGLAGVSVATFVSNFAIYGFRPHRGCKTSSQEGARNPACPSGQVLDYGDQDRSAWLSRVSLVSGWLFVGVAAWGIADAIYNFKPELTLAQRDRGARTRGPLQLVPFMTDRGAGGGLAFRF